MSGLSPYQRIVRASTKGRGVVLSHHEVRLMARDSAILAVAEHDDHKQSTGEDLNDDSALARDGGDRDAAHV